MLEELRARADDLVSQCLGKGRMTQSAFMKAEDAAELSAYLARKNYAVKTLFSGGLEGAERVCLFVFPDETMRDRFHAEQFLHAVKIMPNDKECYTHRDYLGSLMALGLERDTLGDLVCESSFAYLVALPKAAEYVLAELNSVSKTSAACEQAELCGIRRSEPAKEESCVSVSSLRADCVAAEVFRLGRNEAAKLIEDGLFFADRRPVSKPDKSLTLPCAVSLRGKGRAYLTAGDGVSKKGKIRVRCIREI